MSLSSLQLEPVTRADENVKRKGARKSEAEEHRCHRKRDCGEEQGACIYCAKVFINRFSFFSIFENLLFSLKSKEKETVVVLFLFLFLLKETSEKKMKRKELPFKARLCVRTDSVLCIQQYCNSINLSRMTD